MVKVTWPIILVVILLALVVGAYVFWIIYKKKIDMTHALYYNHKKGIDKLCSSSCISPVSRMWVRITFALYSLVSLCYSYKKDGLKLSSYYTVWNYSFLTFYWMVSGYWTYRYVQDSKGGESVQQIETQKIGKKEEAKDKKGSNVELTSVSVSGSDKDDVQATIDSMSWTTKAFRLSIWFFGWHQMCCAPLVATVVWCILFPGSDKKNTFFGWGSVNMHILNVPMIYLDFVIGDQPFEFHFLGFVLVIALCYALWSWCVKSIWGFWPYNFLDTSKEANSIMYFLISVLHVGYWAFVFGFYKLRTCVYARRCCCTKEQMRPV